jgi:hypothetical protein
MTTYSDHQQRLLDQGASIERVAEARLPATAAAAPTPLTRAQKGERVGSGIIVCRRDKKGRLTSANYPFEHPGHDAAIVEAIRLSGLNPGTVFVVLSVVGTVLDDKVK